MVDEQPAAQTAAPGHELRDLNPKNIALFGAALAAIIVAVLAAAYALFHYYYVGESRARPRPNPLSYNEEPVPEPRLEVNPGAELKAMKAEEAQTLNSYGWVDRDQGIVRIPIDRAIAILAQKGMPESSVKNGEPKGNKPKARGGN
jgi:hypothetical protein